MTKLFNKHELVSAVADAVPLTRTQASEAVEAVLQAIESALSNRQQVRLVGFGSFATSSRKAAKGRDPRTGEEIAIPASNSVRFKPGKSLKDAVN